MIRDFTKLDGQSFDLLVCGGGIYGAWTAYDAALRGLKVALVDKADWASGTSSASSKLIHGGLRYLESLDIKLVSKSLRERQMLMQSAPHRVWPLRFGIPVYAGSRLGSIRLKLGLLLYDFLARITFSNKAHKYFCRSDFAQHFPAFSDSNLKGGFTYFDAQTDDARFVLEVVDGAMAAGAVCLNYCEATSFMQESGRITGAYLVDKVSARLGQVHARQVVNTTGQWLTGMNEIKAFCRLTKGVHLVLPKILSQEALLLTAQRDGRVIFMIPWYGLTLIGTTDTDFTGDIEQVKVEEEDIDYLLAEANHVLKNTSWKKSDIIGSYSGLRVLKNNTLASPSSLSRDWELKVAENGMILSIGGKLTSAREDAAQIVDKVCANLEIKADCGTFARPFPWLPDGDFHEWSEAIKNHATSLGIDDDSIFWLIRRHGIRVEKILELIVRNPDQAKRISPQIPLIIADLLFCAQQEMVVHLIDLLRRRLPLLLLSKLPRDEIANLAKLIADELKWDQAMVENEIDRCC
jgi:glycerol-3-phosphate dehydrogenase